MTSMMLKFRQKLFEHNIEFFRGCSTDAVMEAIKENPERYTRFAEKLLRVRQAHAEKEILTLNTRLTRLNEQQTSEKE